MKRLMCMVDHTIVHFEIPAKDTKKLIKFYSDLFGWKMEKVQWMDYWLVETVPVNKQGQPIRQGVNGGLYKKENVNMTPMNYINVESVDEYMEKIKALGGKIIVPKQEIPDMGWTAIAVDPEGNYFGLFQRK
jgi:predicted enzyme related to lactoylglutathione lyase